MSSVPGGEGPAGYPPGAPWPAARHDYFNTGRADDVKPSEIAEEDQDEPWSYETGGPIFFTPSIGQDGTVYVGSADFCFYAVRPDGTLRWKYRTGRYIVGGAAVSSEGTVYVPGADGYVRALKADDGAEKWRFSSRNVKSDKVEMVGWFEGNITLDPGGKVLAPCDDFYLYGINPDGSLDFEAGSAGMIWSAVPTDGEGRHFYCSLDLACYGVDSRGGRLWKRNTRGVLSGSPAIGARGAVYASSHDGRVYAFDAATGRRRWSFQTDDFLCGSPALATDGTIYVGGGDGVLYALSDRGSQVRLLWKYETLEPIRCSPVVDGDGNVYFANGEGKVYALGADGRRRWSLDLSESDVNDINGSIALGRRSLYLGMQDGRLVQVPYDLALRREGPAKRPRSSDPGEDLPGEGVHTYWVTPGGKCLETGSIADVPPGNVMTLRLLVRSGRSTQVAGFGRAGLKVRIRPRLKHHLTLSMDRRYLNIIPDGRMDGGRKYAVSVRGRYRKPLLRLLSHIWLLPGRSLGEFRSDFSFRTDAGDGGGVELRPLLLSSLSFYQPTIFAGLAQIGMDDVKIAVVPIERAGESTQIAWATLAWPREDGGFGIHPGNRVSMPAMLRLHGDRVRIEVRNVAFDQGGDRFGIKLLRVNGKVGDQFDERGYSVNSLYAEGRFISMAGAFYDVPVFGTPLSGTLRIDYLDLPRRTPPGFGVTELYRDGKAVVAEYRNETGLCTRDHHLGILLINRVRAEPLSIDYPSDTNQAEDSAGRALRTRVELPRFSPREGEIEAVSILDGLVLHKAFV